MFVYVRHIEPTSTALISGVHSIYKGALRIGIHLNQFYFKFEILQLIKNKFRGEGRTFNPSLTTPLLLSRCCYVTEPGLNKFITNGNQI